MCTFILLTNLIQDLLGVPILGIPIFGDQRLNIKRASQTGWAITLDYNNISTASVEWALNEILQDK